MTTQKRDLKPFINLVAKLSGAALSFVMLILLARVMSPSNFADFSVLLAWIAIGTTVCCMSMPLVLIRHIPEYLIQQQFDNAKGTLLVAFFFSSLTSCLFVLAIIVVYLVETIPVSDALRSMLLWATPLLFSSVLLNCISGYLQGLKHVIAAEVLINLTRPLFLIFIILTITHGFNQDEVNTANVVAIYTTVSVAILVVSGLYAFIISPPTLSSIKPVYKTALWLRTARGFLIVAVVTILFEKLDIILISLLTTGEATALYAVAAKFSQTIFLAMTAVTAHTAPILSENIPELRAGKTETINRVLQTTTRNMVAVALAAFMLFAIFGSLFVSMFGDYYENAYKPLLILSFGYLVSACLGPSVLLSTFVGETKIAIFSLCCGLFTNLLISLLLTPRFEDIGAAIAMASSLVIASLVSTVLVKFRLNLTAWLTFNFSR